MRKLILFFVLSLMLVPAGQAASGCASDYLDFILSVRTEEMRQGYQRDFFKKSYCQVEDIIYINDQLENLRENFREAAFACEDTSSYKTEYVKLLLEQYFVRNLVNVQDGLLEEQDVADLEARRDLILDSLQSDMQEKFVYQYNLVSKKNLEKYFEVWAARYSDKIVDYGACEDGPWAEATESWNSFVETVKSLSVTTSDSGSKDYFSFESDLDTDVDEFVEQRPRPVQAIKEFYQFAKAQYEYAVDGVPTPNEATAESLSFGSVFEVLEESTDQYLVDIESARRLARYQVIYGEGGSRSAQDLQTLVSQINATLEDSNSSDLPAIQRLVKEVHAKQCR